MGALSIRNIRKAYHQIEILKGIDLEVEAGEFLILVGPSGCGKSTLLSMIAGLDFPTSGTIHIGDKDVTHALPKDRDIAMVFQSYALYPNMNVAQNISFGLEMRKVPKPQREAAVQRVAKMLQIEQLFLFDEPLSNLDAKLRVEMRAEIKLLHQRTHITTVYVTHDQVEAMTLGDRIAVMRDGVVQQFGTPDDIYSRPATRFVAEFIGSPAMNMIEANLSANDGLNAKGIELGLTEEQRQALKARGGSAAPELIYGLRPEALNFADSGLPGQLTMIEPTGPETYAMVETALGNVTARVPGKVSQRVGDRVFLGWAPRDAHLFDRNTERRVG